MSNSLFKKLLLLISFTLGLAFLLFHLGNITGYVAFFIRIVRPFLAGCFTAFLINIPMRWIEKLLFRGVPPQSRLYRFKRGISLVLTLAIVCLILVSVFKLVIPVVGETIGKIIDSVPDAIDQLNRWLLTKGVDTSSLQEQINERFPDLQNISFEHLSTLVIDYASQIVATTTDIAALIVSYATDLVIAVCFSFYLLFSKETLSRQLKKLMYAFLPEPVCDKTVAIGQMCVTTFCDFFSGQFTEACILGSLFLIALSILRLPYTVLISVFIAMMAMIPVIGSFVGCAVGTLLIVMVQPMQAIVFVITFLIIQQLEGNLIYPRVVGGRVGLPAIWVLVAVIVGGGLFGLLGMLLFIPAFSVAYRIIREHTRLRLSERKVDPEKWTAESDGSPLRLHRILSSAQRKVSGRDKGGAGKDSKK